jgi:ribonuclease D
MQSTVHPELVIDDAALGDLIKRLSHARAFAFDTEFVGEDNYEPQICLIQVATAEFCALIDPLTGINLEPFWNLIVDPAMQIIVHAGSEDVGLCFRQTGKLPGNLIDLQIAAGMVGLGYPTSLAKLARATVGVVVHKSQTLTDWRRRPLTAEQIEYAAADVIHLPRMHAKILAKLSELKREGWATEESAAMCVGMKETMNPDNRRRRLRGGGALGRREWAIAEGLMEERDQLAKELNRPPRTVLRDHLLVELAKRGWTDPAKMAGLRGLTLSMTALKRLAKSVEEAKKKPIEAGVHNEPDQDEPDEEVMMSYLNAVLRDHCRKEDIAYGLLVNRQDLRDYVRTYTRPQEGDAEVALHTGWRTVAVGDLLDKLMRGERAVRIEMVGERMNLKYE